MKVSPQVTDFQQGDVGQRSVSAEWENVRRDKAGLPAAIVGGPFPRGQCFLALASITETLTIVTHLPLRGCRFNF
jgi:hypothetical protein